MWPTHVSGCADELRCIVTVKHFDITSSTFKVGKSFDGSNTGLVWRWVALCPVRATISNHQCRSFTSQASFLFIQDDMVGCHDIAEMFGLFIFWPVSARARFRGELGVLA